MPSSVEDTTQDGETVEASRFNGLMSAYQRTLAVLTPEQRAALKGGASGGEQDSSEAGAQAQGDENSDPGDSRQTDADSPWEFEDGDEAVFTDGRFVPNTPTPLQHSETLTRGVKKEQTIAELRAKLDQQVGKSRPNSDPWADLI